MEKKQSIDSLSRSMGAVLGAFCGDAAGGPLEFCESEVTLERVNSVLKMPGGGNVGLGPGQVTDDSELATSLAHGLVQGKGKLDLEAITKWYGEWVASCPFDIGTTTISALGGIKVKHLDAAAVKEQARKYNMGSHSNGSLMRITPLAVWVQNLSDEELEKAVRAEVTLTHPAGIPQQAAVIYCLCIKYLLKGSDRTEAFKKAKEYATAQHFTDIVEWLHLAETSPGHPTDCQESIGYLKHGFVWAMHLLCKNAGYEEAIRAVLMPGGDTDTNACIVGGLIGAAVGVDGVPEKMRKAVLDFGTGKGGIDRPSWLYPGEHILGLVNEIYKMAPTKLEIVINEHASDK